MADSEIVNAEVVSPQAVPGSRIQVSVKFFPMAFLFFFCTPVVVINGVANRLPWGTHQFDFPPGQYHVRIYFPYMMWPECGANETSFQLEPGALRRVNFYMPPWVFSKGSISVS